MPNVGSGLIGLIVLVLMIYAIVKTLQSSAEDTRKILWVVIIILMPLLGSILWFFLGPGGRES